MGTFTLEIQLGNAAMQTPEDVALALRELAERLEGSGPTEGMVRDENGNTVGRWTLVSPGA